MRKGEVKQIELTGQNVLVMRDAQSALATGATQVLVTKRCIITPSARDFLRQNEIEIVIGGASGGGSAAGSATFSSPVQPTRSPANPKLFTTPEAEAVKKEICAVGRKLWHRSFVDGNGGNISYRIGPNEVICTPTLVSKFDLNPEDLCMVDLEGNQIAGTKPRTSEIFLHLEIYKAVPEAKACVHCHPPHATAYAITGRVPPNRLIPEFEVFIGKVAVVALRNAGHGRLRKDRDALCTRPQHRAALQPRHHLLGRHSDPRRVVCRSSGHLLPYPDPGVAVGRAHLANISSGRPPTCWPSRRRWACPTRASTHRP